MAGMSTEAELTVTSIKSQFFLPDTKAPYVSAVKYAVSMRLSGVSRAWSIHLWFIYLHSN